MIRASTLIPALVLAFGVAGASLAMANDSSSGNPTQNHSTITVADNANYCGNAPITEQSCPPNNRASKHSLVTKHSAA